MEKADEGMRTETANAPGMLTCIVCDRAFDTAGNDPLFDTVPYAGTLFYSSGHYGSTVFDSFDTSKLEIIVCDKCLIARQRRVALVVPPSRGTWRRFNWDAPKSSDHPTTQGDL
jgi:hypothetical protein